MIKHPRRLTPWGSDPERAHLICHGLKRSQVGYLVVLCVMWSMAHNFVSLAVFALLFGAANGGCIALYPSVASNWFGTTNLGAILGALYIAVGIAAVAGGSIAGLLYDWYHSYTLSIVLAGALSLLSVAGIVLAARSAPRNS